MFTTRQDIAVHNLLLWNVVGAVNTPHKGANTQWGLKCENLLHLTACAPACFFCYRRALPNLCLCRRPYHLRPGFPYAAFS